MSKKSPLDYIGKKREKKSKTPSFWIDYSENNGINSNLTFWVEKGPVCGSCWTARWSQQSAPKEGGRVDTGNARTRQRSKAGTQTSAFISLCWRKNSGLWLADHTVPRLDLVRGKRKQISPIKEVQVSLCLLQANAEENLAPSGTNIMPGKLLHECRMHLTLSTHSQKPLLILRYIKVLLLFLDFSTGTSLHVVFGLL